MSQADEPDVPDITVTPEDLQDALADIAEAQMAGDKHSENLARRRYHNLLMESHKEWKRDRNLPSMRKRNDS